MTQADFTIANQTFPNTRTELNTSLQALATNSAGNSAPSTTFPNQWHFDSDGNVLYMRNKDNDAWVQILTIGATSDLQTITTDLISEVTSAAGVTIDGLLIKDGAVLGSVGVAGTASTVAGISFYSADDSIYTHDVSGTDSTAEANAAYGIGALDAITTGDANTAIGNGALSGNTTGVENTAIGKATMNVSTSASYNVAIGNNAGSAMTTGDLYNTLVGNGAGSSLTSGNRNIFMGASAGDGHDTETHNLGIGVASLGGSIAGGEFNVCVGNYTGDAITSGDSNVLVGYQAGSAITTGGYNVFIGGSFASYCGASNTTGQLNIGIGTDAYDAADTESNNLAIGFSALGGAVAGGEYNVAIGNLTLDAVTSGDHNTAIGYTAGSAITTGDKNVAVGNYTLDALSSGSGNNTAIGYNASPDQTTGSHNVVIGADGGASIAGNSYNTIIGTHANTKNDNTSDEYQIALGYDCMSVGANFFTFGKSTGNDRVYNGFTSNASWTRVSDERYKKDIQDNTDCGLDFINDLRPVTFKWKEKSELDPSFPDYDAEINNDAHPDKLYGLIAQEVKEALDKNNITDFGGWNSITTGEHTQQGVSQEMFIHPLIKAVQELSATVTTLQQEINTLKGE